MIVDANVLIYAADASSPFHAAASTWLTGKLNGTSRVGLPWQSLTAVHRIVTHPRILDRPLTADHAWQLITDWLDAPSAWAPTETDRHRDVLANLITRYRVTGNLVPDANLAALAIEYGVPVASADTDFARFSEIRWVNPLA